MPENQQSLVLCCSSLGLGHETAVLMTATMGTDSVFTTASCQGLCQAAWQRVLAHSQHSPCYQLLKPDPRCDTVNHRTESSN